MYNKQSSMKNKVFLVKSEFSTVSDLVLDQVYLTFGTTTPILKCAIFSGYIKSILVFSCT